MPPSGSFTTDGSPPSQRWVGVGVGDNPVQLRRMIKAPSPICIRRRQHISSPHRLLAPRPRWHGLRLCLCCVCAGDFDGRPGFLLCPGDMRSTSGGSSPTFTRRCKYIEPQHCFVDVDRSTVHLGLGFFGWFAAVPAPAAMLFSRWG